MTKEAETRQGVRTAGETSRNGGRHQRTEIQGASIDDLSHRLSAIDGVNEDTALFLAHNWKRFLGALGVLILAVVLYYQYKGTQHARLGEAAQRFDEASRGLAKMNGATPEAPVDEKTRGAFFEQLKLLETSNRDSLYGKISGLYAAEAYIIQKEYPAAEAALAKYDSASYAAITAPKNSAEAEKSPVQAELAALLKARLMIARGDTDLAPARKHLTGVALGGRVMNHEAHLARLRIITTPAAHAEAKKTASSLLTARPELREIITSQLSTAGFSVGEG